MIYLFVSNDATTAMMTSAIKNWAPMKSQVQFILGPNGDEVLRACSGLEDYSYIFSLEKNLFQRLIDLRFEIEPDSLVITDLELSPSRVLRFHEAIIESSEKTDFYRLLDLDRLDGAIFITKMGYHRLWSLSADSVVRESQFRWVNLDPDSCLNLSFEKGKNLPNIK